MNNPHHDQLISLGWKFQSGNAIHEHGLYYKRMPDMPECLCNQGKEKQIVAMPYYFANERIDPKYHWSIELEIVGEAESDKWVWLKTQVGQLPPDQWESHINILKRAWKAARQ